MTEKQRDLCAYRMNQAEETVRSAKLCKDNHFYKDAINRAYYASYYAIKAVLAVEGVDFKRHKDVVAYFNQHYVATEIFSKESGRSLARLQRKRETSDYDDFYVAPVEEAQEQIEVAVKISAEVKAYLKKMKIIQ